MKRVWTRPLPRSGEPRPDDALTLAGGTLWFTEAVIHETGRPPLRVAASALPDETRAQLARPERPICGLPSDRPILMGILNVTPDSFSDGGHHYAYAAAVARGRELVAEGADILDVGGESTRPGAADVPAEEEVARVVPVITALREEGITVPISIDTRKADVLRAAIAAGANLLNDVSALRYDPLCAEIAAEAGLAVCLMHAKGDPRTMQMAPSYTDVLVEVADFLAERVEAAVASGIPRDRILVDPGIGFGKTVEHNLALIQGIALFHDLGCPILIGASRKRFIGTLGRADEPGDRIPGSIAVALEALHAGVQVLRVHDVRETRQAVSLWRAMHSGVATKENG